MSSNTPNVTGVIVECSIPDEALKSLIGRNVVDWLEEYGRGVRLTIRENHDHQLVEATADLNHLSLSSDNGLNDTFDIRGVTTTVDDEKAEIGFTGTLTLAQADTTHRGFSHAV